MWHSAKSDNRRKYPEGAAGLNQHILERNHSVYRCPDSEHPRFEEAAQKVGWGDVTDMEAIAHDTGFTTLGQTLGVGASIFLGWNPQKTGESKDLRY